MTRGTVLPLLLGALCAIAATEADKLSKCEQATAAAVAESAWMPECEQNGQYVRKQCNDVICWCVKGKSGKAAFKKQQVPLDHSYDCKKKPKRCLKEELSILLDNSDPEWLPSCDNQGQYEAKQCVTVISQECNVLETADVQGRKKRDAPACEAEPEAFGNDPRDRAALDSAQLWTMVSKTEFSAAGQVRSFEIYSGAAGRGLRVGIYRPTGTTCQFTLVQQKEWPTFPVGYNKVDLEGDDVFQVEAGDSYGFTWMNFGVIDFDFVATDNFCENNVQQDVGATASLVDNRHGKRDYSIRMQFSECQDAEVAPVPVAGDAPAPAPAPVATLTQCDECYCVNPKTGSEERKTRTTGVLICE